MAGRGWTEFLLSQSYWHWIPSLLWWNGCAEIFRWIQWGVFVSRECLALAVVPWLSHRVVTSPRQVSILELFSFRMVLWDAAGACPWHWCSNSSLDIPQQAFFTQLLQSGKKPSLPVLCQIIVDSGESWFMQWVIPLISVGGPRYSAENPDCWGNNTIFSLILGLNSGFRVFSVWSVPP